jgi:membrane protease YdiL (CAAX protease family)
VTSLRARSSLGRALAVELTAVAFAAAYNVVFHRWLPKRAHTVANVGAAAALVATARVAGESWAELGLEPAHLASGVRTGLRAAAPISAIVGAAVALPATRVYMSDERITATSRREATFETLVRIPIETALAEEVIFRGVLLGLGCRSRSPVYAVASTSLLFGLWHVLPTLQALERDTGGDATSGDSARITATTAGVVAVTAGAGAALAWLRLRSGSVAAPIIAHAALNMTAFAGVRSMSR